MSALPKEKITIADYLAFERSSDTRHEYFNGEIFAMAGASHWHIVISGNALAHLHSQLEERQCEVYQSDMRVKIDSLGHYTYPDVVAVCGEPKLEDKYGDTLLNPTLIIEVLSTSTESYDKNAKFRSYRALPSLQECLFISQETVYIEHYTRQNDLWILKDYMQITDIISLVSINCQFSLAKVYAKVVFDS